MGKEKRLVRGSTGILEGVSAEEGKKKERIWLGVGGWLVGRETT